MNKRELSRFFFLSEEIKSLQERINVAQNQFIGASKISDMPKSHRVSNQMEQRILLIEKLTDLLENKKNKALEEQLKIEEYIEQINDIEIRSIFTKRYLEFKRWDKIAKEVNMSESSVFRRHKNQLKMEAKNV